MATQEVPQADTQPIDLHDRDDLNVLITRQRLAELNRCERQVKAAQGKAMAIIRQERRELAPDDRHRAALQGMALAAKSVLRAIRTQV